ncbi:MAG TPA: alternative ribosome rescue aminoacyl-tRNA hydrolase ArfB [Magnetospirillaceae bacterium]|jgi:ribosome-associated protein
MIHVVGSIYLDEREIEERFIRSPGPGGQNVNKLESAVQLRFDVRNSPSLSSAVKERLEGLAGRRLTREGAIVITAHEFRSQERNRAQALDRLLELIREATKVPTIRRATKVPRSAKRKRVEGKVHRGAIKKLRQSRSED